MTKELMKSTYEGSEISFRDDGWFNATEAASRFGKRPIDWLNLKSTKGYIETLKKHLGISEKSSLIKAKRNSGTWMHPKLGVAFARWLDDDFAVWCDTQIDNIVRGKIDHKKLRSEAAGATKVMQSILQLVREEQGKVTAAHHYMNENRVVNYALTGEFKGLDRDKMSVLELNMLAKLTEKNTVLLGRGLDYHTRKSILEQYVVDLLPELKGLTE